MRARALVSTGIKERNEERDGGKAVETSGALCVWSGCVVVCHSALCQKLVLIGELLLVAQKLIDEVCRKHSVRLYLTHCHGQYGWFVTDLKDHTYKLEATYVCVASCVSRCMLASFFLVCL
jgi:hypothetical protein